MSGFEPIKIFVSYSHANEKWANDLIERLQGEGYHISDLPLLRDTADTMIVVTTPAAMVSEGVRKDIEEFTGKIIPVIPPDTPPDMNWIPHHLALLKFADFAHDNGYDRLKALLGAPPRQVIIREDDQPPPFLARTPIGLLLVLVLAAAIVGVLALPEDSSIPDEVGMGMLALVGIGLLLLVIRSILRIRYVSREKPNVPDAFVEIIESNRLGDAGRRFSIKRTFTHIGSDSYAHIRLSRKGVMPEQCRIYYDEHDDLFYLETRHPSAITTLHDRILERDKPLPIWNGDLILLTDQIVLQFRFGKIKS